MHNNSAAPAENAPDSQIEHIAMLTKRLGYKFRDNYLLRQALMHRSHLNEKPEESPLSIERLEFLGYAILSSEISRYLYDHYPNESEGWLTEVRSQLDRNDTLGSIARSQEIGRYLIMGRGVEAQNGRDRTAILGRAWEAIIGAIYLDGGIRSAQRIILRSLEVEIRTIAVAGLARDPKSILQEICQANWREAPQYYTIDQSGPSHNLNFRVEVRMKNDVLGTGEGKSKQSAEKAAANAALHALPEDISP